MVKLLLTGATGKAGGFALAAMIGHGSVEKVVSLQRRPLPDDHAFKNHPKLKELIIPTGDHWLDYPEEVIAELKDIAGCVWALGSTRFPDMATTHRVSTDYTLYGLTMLDAHSTQRPIRFVYLSGAATVRDQDASVAVMGAYRKARGRTENELLAWGLRRETAVREAVMRERKPKEREEHDETGGLSEGSAAAVQAQAYEKFPDFVAVVRAGMITDARANAAVRAWDVMAGTLLYATVAGQDLARGMAELAIWGRSGYTGENLGGTWCFGADGNSVTRIVENDVIEAAGRGSGIKM